MNKSSMKASELFDLTGRVALVTGAATGLGERFAEVLAANGAKVVIVGRQPDKLEAVASSIRAKGGEVMCFTCDVTETEKMRECFDLAEKTFGLVDILVNNAGVAPPAKAVDMSKEHWQHVMDINLNAVWFLSQICAKRLLDAKKGGAIINIASVLGTGVQKGVSVYSITKAAVIQATKAMAIEVANKGIRVNAIAPGYITTKINREYLEGVKGQSMLKQIPAGFYGESSDLDGALLLLASNASRFMSGSVITVDGGHVTVLGG